MQEIIHYTIFTFKLILTPYGIVALLILTGLYAVYLFAVQREHVKVSTLAKLIAYPFMLTYGTFMHVVANFLEKAVVQSLGLLIMLMPIFISFLFFYYKKPERNAC